MEMKQKEFASGYRFFKCDHCNHQWKEKSRDCTSFSHSACSLCYDHVDPHLYEFHYEWPIDLNGNLINVQENVNE